MPEKYTIETKDNMKCFGLLDILFTIMSDEDEVDELYGCVIEYYTNMGLDFVYLDRLIDDFRWEGHDFDLLDTLSDDELSHIHSTRILVV